MKERIDTLKKVPLFRSLPERSLGIIAGLVADERIEEGEEVIREGSEADRLYILVEGQVQVVKNYLKDDATALGIFDPVSVFGEIGLIDRDTRSATVITIERSRFLTLDREAFRILLQNNLEICHALLIEMCARLRQANEIAATR
jgi:CRP/FNR family cyclic AMP-dependent transcriptional regulator